MRGPRPRAGRQKGAESCRSGQSGGCRVTEDRHGHSYLQTYALARWPAITESSFASATFNKLPTNFKVKTWSLDMDFSISLQ
jgi:hypothetical protein